MKFQRNVYKGFMIKERRGKEMEKNTKKILALSVLGIFMFVFALSVVSAAENPIGDWFANWESGQMSANIAKYLFWALVSMVVFSIGTKIPGLKSLFEDKYLIVGVAFSIIVGFLSMAYITPEEVFALMTSYTALGFVLGGALPFIILFFFTITLATETENSGAGQRYMSKWFAWALWLLFTAFIILKIFSPSEGVEVSSTYYTLTIGLAVLSLVATFSTGYIFKKIHEGLREEKKEKGKEVIDSAGHSVKILDQFGDVISK